MVKLSVIIPVYNTEKYLTDCLESVFGQDFQDIEVICVNDGSVDNSLNILEEYKVKYPNLTILNCDNLGSGVARNMALDVAVGDYIVFADSDDWFMDGAFTKLVDEIRQKSVEMLIFGGLNFVNNKLKKGRYSVNKIPKKYLNKIFSGSDIKSDLFKFPATAWTKVYKKEFLDNYNIKFQEIKVGQDQLFFVHSMLKAQKIAVLNDNLYCYRKNRQGSVSYVKKKTSLSPIEVFYAVDLLLKDVSIQSKEFILYKYFKKATFWNSKMDNNLKEKYYANYLRLLEYIKNNYPNVWWKDFYPNYGDSYFSLKLKWYCLLIFRTLFKIT